MTWPSAWQTNCSSPFLVIICQQHHLVDFIFYNKQPKITINNISRQDWREKQAGRTEDEIRRAGAIRIAPAGPEFFPADRTDLLPCRCRLQEQIVPMATGPEDHHPCPQLILVQPGAVLYTLLSSRRIKTIPWRAAGF